ncbi:MAG: hypothetical protein QXZ68_04940 [Candidatus Bathyarchaeia archaeon]
MFGWLQKKLVQRWFKELEANIDGLRKMANDYREQGGFKEVAETLAKCNAEHLIPKAILDEGRSAELSFADSCDRLARAYENLLIQIKAKLTESL